MNLLVTKYCRIKNNCFSINEEIVFEYPGQSATEFLTALYKSEKGGYPKFHKMDNLAKTGFLATDLLLKNTGLFGEKPKPETGLFFSNKSSSLDTDLEFQQTIGKEYFPSPSIFVYTLPNIVMGEIAIKHKIFGENTFFVSEEFDCKLIYNYISQVFAETNMQHAIIGWAEFNKAHCEAFVILVEKTEEIGKLAFTEEIIQKLYKS